MPSARSVLRSGLIVCIAGIIGLAVSATVAAEETGFPFAFGTLADVQTASGVINIICRLAVLEDYTDAELEALVAAIGGLIDSDVPVPPGIVLRVSRQLLSELTPEDLLIRLEELGERIANGEPPGQVANEILRRGNGNSGNNGGNAGGGNGNGNNGDNGGGGNGNGNNGDNDGGGNGNNGGGNND